MADMRNNRRGMGMNARQSRPVERVGAPDMRMAPQNCKALSRKLQVIDFAIVDTVIYLNAYPHCKEALDYYHKLVKEREALCEVINEKCGPITAMGNKSNGEWNWVSGPWPWEPDAN